MNLKIITNQVCNLSRAVGSFIQEQSHKLHATDIEFKGLHNLVTYVDKTSEERLISELSKIIPDSQFIAEESPKIETQSEFCWIIDPLDGTTNFVHGVPIYCISIALSYKSEIVMGVVYEINKDECFYSWKNEKAYLNNRPIQVSKTSDLNHSLLATGFPYYDYGRLDEYLRLFKYFMKNTRGLRRLGSAAADLAYTACGRFDGFYEYGLQSWDVAAGSFILQQAGGTNSDFNGASDFIFGKEIIASNAKIHQQLVKTIKSHFA